MCAVISAAVQIGRERVHQRDQFEPLYLSSNRARVRIFVSLAHTGEKC